MQNQQPKQARNFHHPVVAEKFGQVSAHRRRRGCVGCSKVAVQNGGMRLLPMREWGFDEELWSGHAVFSRINA